MRGICDIYSLVLPRKGIQKGSEHDKMNKEVSHLE